MTKIDRSEWFNQWFNTPYYHILYKNRDEKEAKRFIDAISDYLNIEPGQMVLDIACGKGRHSKYLADKGLIVTGIDLSPKNIKFAKSSESENLHFQVHDMRIPFRENSFNFAFNLFTSFGYFESKEENQSSICNAADSIIKGGKIVIDFLNSYKVVNYLIPDEVKEQDGIIFNIKRYLDDEGYIVKEISFSDNEKEHSYVEKVKAIRLTEFNSYFEQAGLKVQKMFGDYGLSPYDKHHSDRMIFVLEK